MADWRDIADDREKYAAYLCSREWAVLKEAVHDRAGGKCERCRLFPIDAVHHKTYARKYNEQLDDLEGHCKHCHAFTHGKAKFDPNTYECRTIARYATRLKSNTQLPGLGPHSSLAVPFEIQGDLAPVRPWITFLMNAIDAIRKTPVCSCDCGIDFDVDYATEAINTLLPFDYAGLRACSTVEVERYDYWLAAFGCKQADFVGCCATEGHEE